MPIVQMPDGTQVDMPDQIDPPTGARLRALVQGQLAAPNQSSWLGDVGNDIRNAAGGFARSGMGIVSNLMRPLDAMGITGSSDAERMARVNQRFNNQGYDQNSLSFKGGKLGGEVAATAPIGGALAKGVEAIPALAKAVPNLAPALASGGFRVAQPAVTTAGKLGNALLRTGAGGAVGAATAGAINADDTGNGLILGAAMPGGVKLAGVLGNGIRNGAEALVSHALGASTGAGADAIRNAYAAGKSGSTDFLDNMRGNVSFDDVVGKAKQALQSMRMARGAEYRNGMAQVSGDKSVIDFSPISDAMSNVSSMGSYKGQQINKNAAGTVGDLADTVSKWAVLDPAEYHTPEGLDALKQAIGDIRDSTQFGTAARRAADTMYNTVKGQITAQAPVYAKVMGDYSSASDTLGEIEKALSLGDKASKDTAVRKLQSLMRNNAQTSYGNRLSLAQTLEQQGGQSILPSVAGQAMSSATPRGMAGAVEKGTAIPAAIYGALHPAAGLAYLASIPLTSPRMMGEMLYKAGQAANVPGAAMNTVSNTALINALRNPALMNAGQAVGRTIPLAISATP